jgi:hypothetical protein
MESSETDDDRQGLETAEMRISCDEDGALQFHLPDGRPAAAGVREAAIAENRMALVDLLERTAAASQSLLRLGEHQPTAVFRQNPWATEPDVGADPPEPREPDLPEMPKRKFVQWLLPPLWRPVRDKFRREVLQTRQVYLWQHEAWQRTVEGKHAERAARKARSKAANKAEEARFLQRQLKILKGSDPAALVASFKLQLEASPWAASLRVDTAVSPDCRAATFTIAMPSIEEFESICPLPCTVDAKALRLRFEELTPLELKRRYDLYVMASTLKVAAAAFVSMPTLDRATVVAERFDAENTNRFVLAHVAMTRQALAGGWQTPDTPMLELNRLRGKFSLSPKAVPGP